MLATTVPKLPPPITATFFNDMWWVNPVQAAVSDWPAGPVQ
jgi:hypothetical protein